MRRTASPASCRWRISRRTTTSPSNIRRPVLIRCVPSLSAASTSTTFRTSPAYWVGLGLKLAQVALSYGADDLHGTIIEEHISTWPARPRRNWQTEAEMIKAIRESRPHAGATKHVFTSRSGSLRTATKPNRRKTPRTQSVGRHLATA